MLQTWMEQIRSDFTELQAITAEIKRLNSMKKPLREKKKVLEARITESLKEHDLPGVRDGDVVLVLASKSKKVPVAPRKQRQQNVVDILREAGVRDPDAVLERMSNAGKDCISTSVLKMTRVVSKE